MNYHKTVEQYYDEDVNLGFEDRAGQNRILERIRNDFREITCKYSFTTALEIGCGPGFDIAWFAEKYPNRSFAAVDISGEMAKLAQQRINKAGLGNAKAVHANENDLLTLYGEGSFDLIYVYFGALNTVEDLNTTAGIIQSLLKEKGYAVLTFVNKWYLREMIVQLLKLKFKGAFARIRPIWGGYSPNRYLPSTCYSPGRIKKAFVNFKLLERKGYSIYFPAWYNQHKINNRHAKAEALWEKDQKAQSSWMWSKGEYSLFVFQK